MIQTVKSLVTQFITDKWKAGAPFFTAADLPALRAKQRQPIAGEIWQALKQQADRLLAAKPRRPDNSDDSWQQARTAAGNLRVLAFAHAMTGDRAWLVRSGPEIDVILAASSWSDPLHKAVADLVSAEIAWSLALAYDWMYAGLSETQRQRLREAIIRRGLEPIYAATERGVWWSHWPRGNWGAVILGKAGVAAMALLADEPRAADWLRISRDKMLHYIAALGPDGGWAEGISYAAYCWFNVIQFFDALPKLIALRAKELKVEPSQPESYDLSEYYQRGVLPDPLFQAAVKRPTSKP